MMRFYQHQQPYYCGVDLHARTLHVCIVDASGLTREHVNLPCDPGRFLKLVEPYRAGLVVSCECLFAWYWLADLCRKHEITFPFPCATGAASALLGHRETLGTGRATGTPPGAEEGFSFQ